MSLKLFNLINRTVVYNCQRSRCMSFKSDLSLDKIYPSSVEIKPFVPPKNDTRFTGYIPIKDLTITYARSSGPGGQHVNKNLTKVDVRFHVESADWMSQELKQKILEKLQTRINKDGYLIFKSERTRDALVNRLDAITKMREVLFKLDEVPEPISEVTLEKIRKQKEKAARIRLIEKRRASLDKRWKRVELDS